MRVLLFDPGRTAPGDWVRNLRFDPKGHKLGATLGEPDGLRDPARYDLARDKALGEVAPNEFSGFVADEGAIDPVWSLDLELALVPALSAKGMPSLALIDTWSDGEPEWWLDSPDELKPFAAAAFAPDGNALFTALAEPDRTEPWVRVYELGGVFESDGELADWERRHFDHPRDWAGGELTTALEADPRGLTLVVGTSTGGLWQLDLSRETAKRKLVTLPGSVESIAFGPSPRWDRLLVRTTAGLFTVREGEVARWGPPEWAHASAALSPDGELVAVATPAGELAFGCFDAGNAGERYDAGIGPLHGVAFAPDGLTVAAGGEAGRVVIWDVG